MGRLLKGRESQKTCLNNRLAFEDRNKPSDLEDEKGTSPDRFNFGPGIFFKDLGRMRA